MITKRVLLKSLLLITFCITIIVVFTLIYMFFDFLHIGGLIDENDTSLGQLTSSWSEKFSNTLYFSSITLFSVGYGDITPVGWSRFVSVVEAASGYILPAVLTARYLKKIPPTSLKKHTEKETSS